VYLSSFVFHPPRRGEWYQRHPYAIHQVLAGALEGEPRVLFRITEYGLVVQTEQQPEMLALAAAFGDIVVPLDCQELDTELIRDGRWRFELVANPTMRESGSRKRMAIRDDEQVIAWLERKGEAGGFEIETVLTDPGYWISQTKPTVAQHMRLWCVPMRGVLTVTDAERMRETITRGIGSGKGLGCGLLTINPY
jgi:CRISPR system Cascade subunit CasE